MPVGLNTLRDHAMVHTRAFHLLGKEHCYDANKNNVGKMMMVMMVMMGENKERRKRKDASDSWHLLSH